MNGLRDKLYDESKPRDEVKLKPLGMMAPLNVVDPSEDDAPC